MNKRLNRSPLFESLYQDRGSLLSLSPLNTMLTQAQKDLPPRVVYPLDDARDELALELIAGIKRRFRASQSAHWIGSSLGLEFKEETVEHDV